MSSNPPRRRLRRVLLVLVVSILVAAGVLWGVARYFLGTRVTPVVAARLQSAYGGPVHVGAADIGLRSTSIRDVELFEPSPSASELPWIKIDAIHTDLSAWDLVRGKTSPGKLALEGPAVTLRIDKQGRLLTRLPHAETRQLESVPGIEVKQGRISFLQEDRPDFVLGGVDGSLRAEGERLLASGTISDPLWGQWTFSGWLDQRSHEWSASLNTGHAVLTKQMLSSLPFIPLSVWQQVQIDAGETAADITIRYDPVARQAHYRIQLKVQQTSLLVTAIGLAADQAGGTVEIEDGL
ncbi:MAG TPA: hypothetical protein VKI17_05795, partial [Gemmataceae bacterium]|nr:hypothetical protein [Gemmataceae bacterium]